MDLSTTYLGLKLKNPIMPGASPLVDDLGVVRRLEDSGAAAIVMHSLFEEQVLHDRSGALRADHPHPGALSHAPPPEAFRLDPEQYAEQLRRIKQAVAVPVIASLNGVGSGGWLDLARMLEQAGASALELNPYLVAADPDEDGASVEARLLEVVRIVLGAVSIPVAVKIGPFFSSLAHFARRLDATGVRGIVLFNRFWQPDIDIDTRSIAPTVDLSESDPLRLRLRWLAILSGRVRASLAASGGVHTAEDVVKAVMAGADAVQMTSALLRNGPGYLKVVIAALAQLLQRLRCGSIAEIRGAASLARCADPGAFERGGYVSVLQSLRV